MIGQRTFAASVLVGVVLLIGCDDLQIGRTSGPVGNEAQTATDLASGLDEPGAPPAGTPAESPPLPQQAAAPSNQPSPSNGTHVGKKTGELLDAAQLKNDPNWIVVADDPSKLKSMTVPGTVYNRAAALSGTVGLTQWIKQQHALTGKYPTYKEVIAFSAKYPSNRPALQEFRHYGYDETTGQMVILENRKQKQMRKSELGLE